jgi:hypothetical protein
MHIIKSIAFAAATVCASQAYALTPTQMNDPSTLKVYVGGATALSAAIGGLFTQNCNPATRTDYTYTTIPLFGRIYTCTLNAVNDFGLGAVNVMFQKRDQGGSGIGVYPLTNNTDIEFINPTSCTGPASGVGTCPDLVFRKADGGISDLEPSAFAALANTPAEFVGTEIGNNSTSLPINSTVFGLAVTQALYDQLQADQGLAVGVRPTVPQAAVGQILRSGFLANPIAWTTILPNSAAALQSRQVNICRRVDGSGTQAGANRFFLEYPYNSGSSMVPLGNLDSTAVGLGNTAGRLYVQDNSTSGDVRNCLIAAQAASTYAIGHLSLESAENAGNWRFVRIGGQVPSRDEAKNGRYAYFFESTCQIANGAAANVKSFLNSFCSGASSPTNLAQLATAVQNGVMANPSICPSPFGSGTANQQTFCARVTRNGNSAEFPSFAR